MATVACRKCGVKLDVAPYGKATKENVVKLASDHASKLGCDYPAQNVDKVLTLLKG